MPYKSLEKRRLYSREWREKHKVKRKPKPAGICLTCQNAFKLKRKEQKYCSRKCFYTAMIGHVKGVGRKHSVETKKKMSVIALKNGRGLWNKGRVVSRETGEKISKKKRGSRNNNWKGGITPKHRLIRGRSSYKRWRTLVFERDNYTCQGCGIKNEKGLGRTIILNAHHIKSFARFPELPEEIDNGITLCVNCHDLTKQGRHSAKKNDFNNFELHEVARAFHELDRGK